MSQPMVPLTLEEAVRVEWWEQVEHVRVMRTVREAERSLQMGSHPVTFLHKLYVTQCEVGVNGMTTSYCRLCHAMFYHIRK